jgi:hypothetical protein
LITVTTIGDAVTATVIANHYGDATPLSNLEAPLFDAA